MLEFGTFESRSKRLTYRKADQFISYHVDVPEAPESKIKFINLHRLLCMYLAFLILALLVLMFEYLKYKIRRRIKSPKVVVTRVHSVPVQGYLTLKYEHFKKSYTAPPYHSYNESVYAPAAIDDLSGVEIQPELFTRTMIPAWEGGSFKDIDCYLEDIEDEIDIGTINDLVCKF